MRTTNPIRRARTEETDTKITAVALEIEALCKRMVAMTDADRSEALGKVVELTGRKTSLQFERDRIIRDTFYGRTK